MQKCQAGFIPGDSCVSQFLCIIHDCNHPVHTRGMFLDISKAFDKVWHEGLIFKLQSHVIEGTVLVLLKNHLTNHKQRVALNGQTSLWNCGITY